MFKKNSKLSYEKKKSLIGVVFISPFIIGFLVFFLKPMVQSLIYTFNDLKIKETGFQMIFIGLENYKHLFFSDPDYLRTLGGSLGDLVYKIPTIMVFSLIVALILDQKFIGRTLSRAIFFLPVIIASGVVINILNGDLMSQMILSGEKTSSLFQVSAFEKLLFDLGLQQDLINFIVSVSNNIFELSWLSGIQILLFIAGLQTVPRHLYEAGAIDGTTKWEAFWKITFPLITPVIIINLIYTITDSFTSYNNQTMRLILKNGQNLNFAISATMAWIYFAVIVTVVGIVYKIVDKRVVYV